MTDNNEVTTSILEDLLFQRRLQRNLNSELERLYHLLVEQVRLLREREALTSGVQAAVQQRRTEEEQSTLTGSTEHIEGEESPERPSLADYKDEEE